MTDFNSLVYLDYNATTKVAEEVVDSMLPFFKRYWGNPSSAYAFGHATAVHIEKARRQCAEFIGAEPGQILFTSSGTESNNTAINAALRRHPHKRHVVMSAVEHSANTSYGQYLNQLGYEVTYIPVDPDGSMDLVQLAACIRSDTAIVSVMWANNETGVLFPVEDISALCRSCQVPFHTDAVQVAGKIPIDVRTMDVDYLSLSGHKFHAPKGIGILFIKNNLRFNRLIQGGGQEKGRRGGTENVPAIVGIGCAASLAMDRRPSEKGKVLRLRNKLELGIETSIPHVHVMGKHNERLDNTCNVLFERTEAEAVLLMLDRLGICASSGSACTTGSLNPSHVLRAMGYSPKLCMGSIRFSLGQDTTEEEIDFVLGHLPPIISRLRGEGTVTN